MICTFGIVLLQLLGLQFFFRRLRTRRAFNNVPLRTRRALSLYNVYGNSALLVLNETLSNCDNALLALNWGYAHHIKEFTFSSTSPIISIESIWLSSVTVFQTIALVHAYIFSLWYVSWKWRLKDNLPHNTYQIYVKSHLKNTQMTLEYQIFNEKALE